MRPILWYIVLVGLPVAAMLGILRLGEGLEPPRAAHGHYSVTFDSSGAGHCLTALVSDGDRRLDMAQSGPKLDVTFGPIELFGTINADTVYAVAPMRDNALLRAASCLTVDTLAFSVVLPPRGSTDSRLTGSFLFPGCSTCPSVPFRATRVSDHGRGGGR